MDSILPEDAPAPRLCHLIKWPDFDGYGFNLHAERSNPGQFIGKIDDSSPAQMAGLKEGDRIIEVNGVNIHDESHRQVVDRIKSHPEETKLLVIDPVADSWYCEQNITIRSDQMNVVYIKTPVPRPQPDSPRARNQQSESKDEQSFNADTNSMSSSTKKQEEKRSSVAPADSHSGSQHESPTKSPQEKEQDEPTPVADIEAESPTRHGSDERTHSTRVSPPMSPDSGKGDDVCENNNTLLSGNGSLTVEAEINRQSPSNKMLHQLASSPDSAGVKHNTSASILSDSISSNEPQCNLKKNVLNNGNTDSGQISSSDAMSSNGSIDDSLEDHSAHMADESRLEKTKYDQTKGNLVDPTEAINKADNNVNTEPESVRVAKANRISSDDVTSPNVITSDTRTQITSTKKEDTRENQVQKTVGGAKNTSSHVNTNAGLNLNMTAGEMRELIARRKKFDPKKVAMNIRQKYEIIQQM